MATESNQLDSAAPRIELMAPLAASHAAHMTDALKASSNSSINISDEPDKPVADKHSSSAAMSMIRRDLGRKYTNTTDSS